MSDEIILTKGDTILTKPQSDLLSAFQGIDVSKL